MHPWPSKGVLSKSPSPSSSGSASITPFSSRDVSGMGTSSSQPVVRSSDNAFTTTTGSSSIRDVEMKDMTTEDEDAELYAKSVKLIADKVKAQHEGTESNMLTVDHKDDDYQMSVDQVQALLRSQRDLMFKRQQPTRSGGGLSGLTGIFASSSSTPSLPSPQLPPSSSGNHLDKRQEQALATWMTERAKFVPMRLTLEERKKLRLIDAILRNSTYVNRVDALQTNTNKDKAKRTYETLKCLGETMKGIITALDYGAATTFADDRSFKGFKAYENEIRELFEIARRYKIMNPDRLRESYGTLIMLMQDASCKEGRDVVEFDVVAPIKTVYDTLEEGGCLELLSNEWCALATMEITNDLSTDRNEVRKYVKAKEQAMELLAKKGLARGGRLDKDNIKQCLYSLGDNQSYLNSNCKPIDEMIVMLRHFFDPVKVGPNPPPHRSLAIMGGMDGSRLTHDHTRQYNYVLQTLSLWREILHEIFRLWTLSERDLLDSNSPYKFRDTGQGRHRLQDAPRIKKAMHGILYSVQQNLGTQWVGSSVIHINDTNVPNALVFIDKWNQVPRILNPIVQCLKNMDSFVATNPGLVNYVNTVFGSMDDAKACILHSFFREGFDGSGGDDWFSAGSCVDARLTSAWNWCQGLQKKNFFFLFRLAGFTGFDGEW